MIGDRIRYLRKERRLNQHEFAELVDASYDKISRWETGKQAITLPELLHLAEVLGQDPAWFYEDERGLQPQEPTLLREALKASVRFLAMSGRLNQPDEAVAEFLADVADFYSDPARPRRREAMEEAIAALFSKSSLS